MDDTRALVADFDGREKSVVESFPGVPYTKVDSNDYRCKRGIKDEDYQRSAVNVRNCRLTSLLDLDQGRPWVRKMMTGYLNKLIEYGVAGFR
ncbi:hypothetical protein COOONC_07443 [Cooperia oncophora]